MRIPKPEMIPAHTYPIDFVGGPLCGCRVGKAFIGEPEGYWLSIDATAERIASATEDNPVYFSPSPIDMTELRATIGGREYTYRPHPHFEEVEEHVYMFTGWTMNHMKGEPK